MNAESRLRTAPSINGHMIIIGVGHLIAIYERDRDCYVAEFRDGGARLENAGSWFRFHGAALRRYSGRAAPWSSMPLTPEILEKVERLHAEREARQKRVLAVPRTVVAAARRHWIKVISRLRGHAARRSHTVG